MNPQRRLEEIFSHFPGIGPRQARRFVYYLLGRPSSSIQELLTLIDEVRSAACECSQCHRFFIGTSSKPTNARDALCPICSDGSRDTHLIMIVARDSDLETVEKSGAYKGLYFVLGGTVPLLDKDPEKRIRLRSLLERLSQPPMVREAIISLSTTPDGDHTATIVREAIRKVSQATVTVLGRGLSTGAELEYADSETIRSALQNRK